MLKRLIACAISFTTAYSMEGLYYAPHATINYSDTNQVSQGGTVIRCGNNFNNDQLKEVVQKYCDFIEVDNNPNLPYNNKEKLYGIYEKGLLTIITEQQLINTITTLFATTYENLKNTSEIHKKLAVADAFYRIVYHPYKLLFILSNNDLNTFNIINNILNELKPLCTEHAVANIGPKEVLYGIDKLNASLNSINEQFTSGLNCDINLTEMDDKNLDYFKKQYIEMFCKNSVLGGCLDTKILNHLIGLLKNYSKNYDDLTNNKKALINNLISFFKENLSVIEQKSKDIINNTDNLFQELLKKQTQEVNIDELLDNFYAATQNINNLDKDSKIDTLSALFNRLFINKTILPKILEVKDPNTLYNIKYLLNIDDVKQVNMYDFIKLDGKKIWQQVCEECDKGVIDKNKKIEVYYEFMAKQSMGIFNGVILPTVDIVQHTKNIDKELQKILLGYYSKIGSTLLTEFYKYKRLIDNKTALVPADFWNKKTIDFTQFENNEENNCIDLTQFENKTNNKCIIQ